MSLLIVQTAVEIANYLTSTPSCHDLLLEAECQSDSIYPNLCQLARIHLSSSASSVPVESMFSTASLVANSKRSSLSADKLHRICFIHDNFKFV